MKTLLLTLGLVLLAASAGAESLAIVGGTVFPVSADPYVGTVVVRDGTIEAAGPDVSAPADARVIDAAGLNVYPGMMDAMSNVGLTEISAVPATDDRSEMGTYNSHLEAATAVHPASALIGVARANGITHAMICPRTSGDGVIAGRSTVAHFEGWTIEEMAISRSHAMIINFPSVQTRRFDFSTFSFKETAFNEAKEKAEDARNELLDWLDAARHYQQAHNVDSPRAGRDLRLSYLAECLDGGKLVILQTNNKLDIEAAVEFGEEHGLNFALAGASDAWEVADMLAEKGVGVILGATQSNPRQEDDPYDRPYHSPSILVEAGVKIAFASGAAGGFGSSPHAARTIPYQAATAAGYGLSEEDALKSVTLWPAEILGLADQLGTIDQGKIANLVVMDGDMLEIRAQVKHLIINGDEVSTQNRHRELYETYRARGAE